MYGINLLVANKIFESYGINFKKHDVAGYLVCKGAKVIHTDTLTKACQSAIDTWFIPNEES
ncbi:MAG: hypothetical protein KME49_22825 [Brasilonema octagenarum HA4186-MV1]|nr:hypothetical protein [Brasilonema octagenarum HA4186-MV1]